MEKHEYLQIRDKISFERPFWPTAFVIGVDIGILYIAIHLLALDTMSAFLASQLLLAVFYFHNFALLHEAGHGNISNKRWMNDTVGHYASLFCFLPYFPWKYIHNEHHVWTGNIDKDPTMAKIKEVREKKHVPFMLEFAWRSWIPLAAFTQQIVFWTYPFKLLRGGKMSSKVLYQSIFSVVWMILVYLALHYFFPHIINFGNFWLSYVFYMTLTELVNLPHHIQMPTFHTTAARSKLHPWEQHITTRSCDYGWVSGILALNFNYHIEHHFYPTLPWYRLRKLRQILKPILGAEYTELRGIGWNLQNRAKSARNVILPEVTHPCLQ